MGVFPPFSERMNCMNKRKIVFILLMLVLLLGGCSSKAKTSGKVKVTEENKSYLEVYDESLQGFIMEMSDILQNFNTAVDGIYTQQYSEDQFATILKKGITDSNKLVTTVEEVDVRPELFDAHQTLILLVNRSHQLLLDSIDMVNDENRDIDKSYIRTEYIAIKQEQSRIANQWKILREELNKTGGEVAN
jgi:hypothetical protein